MAKFDPSYVLYSSLALPPNREEDGDLGYVILWLLVFFLIALLLWFGLRFRRLRRLASRWQSVAEWKHSSFEQDLQSLRLEALMEGVGQERSRVAKELHDNLGSLLATVRLYFYSIDPYLETLPEQLQYYLRSAAEINAHSLDEVRRIAHTYGGGELVDFDLLVALGDYLDLIAGTDELTVSFEVMGQEAVGRLAPSISMSIFRVAQELICNVLRHASASRMAVQLAVWEGGYRLVVLDDGCGFAGAEAGDGMGLANVADRVAHLGGQFRVCSVPGAGTWGGVWGGEDPISPSSREPSSASS